MNTALVFHGGRIFTKCCILNTALHCTCISLRYSLYKLLHLNRQSNMDHIDIVHAVILPITTGICHRLKYTVQSSPISINCISVSAFPLLCSLLNLISTAFVHSFSQLSRGIFTRSIILNSGETLLMKGNYYE